MFLFSKQMVLSQYVPLLNNKEIQLHPHKSSIKSAALIIFIRQKADAGMYFVVF
jgi:hypothetical protein